jgi:hypothetical protein
MGRGECMLKTLTLIKRLRPPYVPSRSDCEEAAAEIERLEADNAALHLEMHRLTGYILGFLVGQQDRP